MHIFAIPCLFFPPLDSPCTLYFESRVVPLFFAHISPAEIFPPRAAVVFRRSTLARFLWCRHSFSSPRVLLARPVTGFFSQNPAPDFLNLISVSSGFPTHFFYAPSPLRHCAFVLAIPKCVAVDFCFFSFPFGHSHVFLDFLFNSL